MAGSSTTSRGRRLVRLYPARWRARYEEEMLALLAERPPTVRDAIDLVRCALDAHLHPDAPSRIPALAALLAGAAWTVVALAVLAEPVAPDWPGFLAWTLVPGLVAAAAGLVASVGLALRLEGDRARSTGIAIGAACAGQLSLVTALAVAVVGGPYGAVTGAAGSLAAVGIAMLGLALLRNGWSAPGTAMVTLGGALLVPAPVAWVLAAAIWTGIGLWLLVERSGAAFASRP